MGLNINLLRLSRHLTHKFPFLLKRLHRERVFRAWRIPSTCALGCQLPFWEQQGDKGNIEMFSVVSRKKHPEPGAGVERGRRKLVWDMTRASQPGVGSVLRPGVLAPIRGPQRGLESSWKMRPPGDRHGLTSQGISARPLTHGPLLFKAPSIEVLT